MQAAGAWWCYDRDSISTDTVIRMLDTLSIDQLTKCHIDPRWVARAEDNDTPPWLSLALSTAAVALGLLESVFTPWIVIPASVPIFTRAFDALAQHGALH